MVETAGQQREAATELAITEIQTVTGREKEIIKSHPAIIFLNSPTIAVLLMPDDLKNWISDILTLEDLGQSSGAELVRHLLVKSIQSLQ